MTCERPALQKRVQCFQKIVVFNVSAACVDEREVVDEEKGEEGEEDRGIAGARSEGKVSSSYGSRTKTQANHFRRMRR